MANFTIFGPFWVVFVFLTLFFRFFGGFQIFFGHWASWGVTTGQFTILHFNFFGGFWIFSTFLGFWLQWRFGDLLGVLVNYKIPRGIKLVVWRVFERLWGVLGVSGRVQGLQRWVNGVLLDPYIALFAPLEILQKTRLGCKHHIIVQLANVYRVVITGIFWSFGAPQGAPKMPLYEQIKLLWNP